MLKAISVPLDTKRQWKRWVDQLPLVGEIFYDEFFVTKEIETVSYNLANSFDDIVGITAFIGWVN